MDTKDDDGVSFEFSEHQFRRFWAMTYYYKYPKAELAALSWFLRHSSFEMTTIYITDENMSEVAQRVKEDRIIDMIEGGEATDESDVVSELQEAFTNVDLTTDKVLSKMEQKHELTADYVMQFVADGARLGGGPNVRVRSKCLQDGHIQPSSADKGSCQGALNPIPLEPLQGFGA